MDGLKSELAESGKVTKLAMALRDYFQSEPLGKATPLGELKPFLAAMSPVEREAAAAELGSYGYNVTLESS